MRVYLSVPMITNPNLDRTKEMAKAIGDAGHEVTSTWVLGPSETHDPGTLNIFERDRFGAETSDAIVADVTSPSTGVGMELMAAHYGGRRVILVMKRGSLVSRMLLQMEPKEVVEFENVSDLYVSLRTILESTGDKR